MNSSAFTPDPKDSRLGPATDGDGEFWCFPLEAPTPRHQAAIERLLVLHPDLHPISLDGRLVAIIGTRPAYRALLIDTERRAREEAS